MNNKSNEQLGRELAEKAGLRIIADRSVESTDRNNYFMFRLSALCESLDAIAEIEKIVMDKIGKQGAIKLAATILFVVDGGKARTHFGGYTEYDLAKVSFATPRQRAEACLLALSTEKI